MNSNSVGSGDSNPGASSVSLDPNPVGPATEDGHDESVKNTSPVRRLFESALREGPLFRPEGVVADKVSETAGQAAAEKYLAQAKGVPDSVEAQGQTAGWIFVTSSTTQNAHLRIAVSERDRTENAADFDLDRLSQHLGLDTQETLRYAAFSHDAYRALATARKALSVFETENRRYHCPSAVAATAIESARDTISSRKTNFEASRFTPRLESEPSGSHSLKASLPQLLIEDEKRVERHAAISSLMQETEKSLSEASELLDGVKSTKRSPVVRRQLPGMIWRRGRRDSTAIASRPRRKSQPKLASRGVLTAPIVQTMEQAIMRREASQYLNQRRLEMKRVVLMTFIATATVSAIALLASEIFPVTLSVVYALAIGSVCSLAAHLLVKRRYAKPTTVWKEILDRPIPAPR